MSKSRVLGIGFVLLVVGFMLGHAITPSPSEPKAPPTPAAAAPPEPRVVAQDARDMAAAILRDAMRETDPFARITRVAAVLPALGPEIAPEIRAVLDDDTVDVGIPELDLLLRGWAKTDPWGATRWSQLHLKGEFMTAATNAITESWAGVDPVAAAAMVKEMSLLPNAATRTGQIALVRGWFNSGIPGLTEYIEGLGMGYDRQRAVDSFTRAMIQRDGTEAVVRWADAIPSDDAKFKLDVNRHAISTVARFSPAAAAAWCRRICDGPTATSTMTRSMVARRWAEKDGPSAMEWLANAPSGQERDWAVRAAFRQWSRHDPKGIRAWADAMGVDGVEPWFQPGLELLAISLIYRDPNSAARWVGAIENEADRERVYVTLARGWRTRDAAAADEWIEQMEFSESVRDRILAPSPPQAPGGGASDADAVGVDAVE